MEIEIDQKILDNTDCPHDFSCINGGEHKACDVTSSVGSDYLIIFVNKTIPDPCQYCASFGHSTLCACPTRKEIYRKYEI
ncbi:MAG: hypothetical protein ABH954_03560 [Candidatus Omnitrophota bacterium]